MKQYRQIKGYLEAKGYWEKLVYLFFGGLATIVNFVSFALARQYFDLSMALFYFMVLFCIVCFCDEQTLGIPFKITEFYTCTY